MIADEACGVFRDVTTLLVVEVPFFNVEDSVPISAKRQTATLEFRGLSDQIAL